MPVPLMQDLKDAVKAHDDAVAASGLRIWLGAEPTFSRVDSTLAEWQTAAEGDDKLDRARAFAKSLAESQEAMVLRTLGRQYPSEDRPRFSFGVIERRDGTAIWSGPSDPILQVPDGETTNRKPADFVAVLAAHLEDAGYKVRADLPSSEWGCSLMFGADESLLEGDWDEEEKIIGPPLETVEIPPSGAVDQLAETGRFVIRAGKASSSHPDDADTLQVELPAIPQVAQWLEVIDLLGRASSEAKLQSMIITGYPPPTDESMSFTTVTPDPGVIEINMAPCANLAEFAAVQQRLHDTAHQIGLGARKLMFNGEVADSGGGQHLTFGGPTPETSPFLVRTQLLPRLIAYVNQHPCLSYWFAVRAVGSSGQQPRADEVAPENLDGLQIGLDRLFGEPEISPELLWRSLAPFMCDRFGNTHRAEINVEKLWNPFLHGRGRLGLVELRAFGMAPTPEKSIAVSMLMRAILCMLAEKSEPYSIRRWGELLHDRFSLPYYLREDLRSVLKDLDSTRFALPAEIANALLDDSTILIATRDLGGAHLTVRQAVEFWPVVGDLSAQDLSFRTMDSSTVRIEVMLEPTDSNETWRLSIGQHDVPWVEEERDQGKVLIRGIRYKSFHPMMPVLPLVEPLDPLTFTISSSKDAYRCSWFNWRAEGGAYDDLPRDASEAARRRDARLIVEPTDKPAGNSTIPTQALSEHCVDLRVLPFVG